jgi:hypothetical protein
LYAIKDFDLELHFYGVVPPILKKFYDRIVERNMLTGKVFFHDPETDKNILYTDCNYLILPSVSEGIPFCILEALVRGVPVISSNIGDINQYITDGKNGYLFDLSGLKDHNDTIIIDYEELLNEIGYVKSIIQINKNMSKDLLEDIGMLMNKTLVKLILPPPILGIMNRDFDENILAIKNVINKAMTTNLMFSQDDFIKKTKTEHDIDMKVFIQYISNYNI